ncbi:LysR family transcriptional regulator [Sphingomonas abietis]|uniref:LysR substrate-binding domain-containing protein n=1 Tax=Sphingomonas abietis TaxID=3012344 RepID=A0ABY7NX67_9SPHN|nr:LysR family transcriptional regulator [Sphingomonas abietis]WBO23991.1 LysR substrate-binding domain-containing protein [Sphingomonas abietis]
MTYLEDLAVFVRIAAAGSLSAAARDLGMSLTVVSKRLVRLEAALNVRLVNRSSRRTSLTNDGAELLPRARDILARVEEAEAALQSRSTEAAGILRVTATIAFASGQIAPRLGRFMARNPDLRIQLLSTDRMLDIVQDNVDVAIRQAVLPDSDLVSRTLVSDRRVLVSSPDYLARHGTPAVPQDLAKHRCIVLGDPPVTEWRFQRGARKVSVDVGWTLLANDGVAAQAACLGGAGIALKSIWDAREDLATGRLVEVLPGWVPPSMPIQAVFASRHHQPARIRAFVDFLQEELRNEIRLHPIIDGA